MYIPDKYWTYIPAKKVPQQSGADVEQIFWNLRIDVRPYKLISLEPNAQHLGWYWKDYKYA